MTAIDHTHMQIEFFKSIGVKAVDVRAVKQDDHTDKPKGRKNVSIEKVGGYTKWLYYMNARESRNIYITPSINASHAYVFLDDLTPRHAARLAQHARTLRVRTSTEGGYQAWVETDRAITIDQRGIIQKKLCIEYHSDPHSVDGGHYGRLAGYKNIKRGGNWINCKPASSAPPLPISMPAPSCIHAEEKTACESSQFDNFDKLHAALDCICADDYDVWLKVGMALHSIDQREIWDAWSARSAKFDLAVQDEKWPGFGGRVTVRSIFWLANQS